MPNPSGGLLPPFYPGGIATPPPTQPGFSDSLIRVARYVGAGTVPQDVKRRRRLVYDAMRRFGTPVIVKHMFHDEDAERGFAERSLTFQDPYGQVRAEDPLSFGIGYVSAEKSEDEWIAPTSATIVTSVPTGATGYVKAPRYRGFGPGYLTYIIEPDVAEDMFKLTPSGALIKTSVATAQAPWYPEINDNDMIINVELDSKGRVLATRERYQAKMTSPVSIRGLDRRGRREDSGDGGNRFVINQTFEMTLVPTTSALYKVETDR